jgi:hypothetical protein
VRWPRIAEPGVTLTDYGLAAENAVLAFLIWRRTRGDGPLRSWLVLLFGSAVAASTLGGTVHGFFAGSRPAVAHALWKATLLSIGVTAFATELVAARTMLADRARCMVGITAALKLAGYSATVLLRSQQYRLALMNGLVATVFMFAACIDLTRRARSRQAMLGLAGVALGFAAAGVQRSKIALHPRYLDHNALYHLIQGVTMLLIFLSARWLAGPGAGYLGGQRPGPVR